MQKNKVHPDHTQSAELEPNLKYSMHNFKTEVAFVEHAQVVGTFFCQICKEDKGMEHRVGFGGCQHWFCFGCVDGHVGERMRQGWNITCCADGCNQPLFLNSKHQTPKSKTYLQKLPSKKRKSLKKYTKNYQALTKKCPNCSYNPKNELTLQCKPCQSRSLPNPNPSHLNPSPQPQIPQTFKKCRSCNKLIQKQKGCDHVKCICGHQFCFGCLEVWDKNHICQFKVPKRTGLAWCGCFVLKLPLYACIGGFLFGLFGMLAGLICLLSAGLFGMFVYFKLIEKLTKYPDMSGCIRFILFILSLLMMPILIIGCIVPGFFIPIINIWYKEKIFLQPSILSDIAISMFGCLGVIKLL